MKKKILGLAAVTMAAVLIAGGSYAYLQNQTEEKTNTFTMGEGVKAEISEPFWDGEGFTGNDFTGANGEDLSKDPLFNTGETKAANFIPGDLIAKNPIIKNTSTSTDVYTAVKISYGTGIANYAELSKFATIDFNTTDWEFNTDYTVAYYKTALKAGKVTPPVFTGVTISEDATDPTLPGNDETAMKNFDITVTGFICQTEVAGATTSKEALDTVFGDNLK